MKSKLSLTSMLVIAFLFIYDAYAIEISGTVMVNAPITEPSHRAASRLQSVTLMKLDLTEAEVKALSRIENLSAKRLSSSYKSSLPEFAEIDMSNTSVLDQGLHGTCVTFATTGALNSLLNKDDYISQLCSLELGSYLEENAYTYSGWDGSFGYIVLNQFMTYGIVSTEKQKNIGCAGIFKYPRNSPANRGKPIALDEYHKLSESINNDIYWESMLGIHQAVNEKANQQFDGDRLVENIKEELVLKHNGNESRITFGIIVPRLMCYAGACGKYQAEYDTWVLTRSMNREFKTWELGGHEMIIIGYDNNATIIDSEGGVHQGVFKLRNSWGPYVGDKGNYYMTYDFFKRFVMEVQRIVKINKSENK